MAMYVEAPGPGRTRAGTQVLGSGKVLVSTGLTSQGQGHETAFAQIVASELGVPIEDIEVTTGDTRRFAYAVGTFASRAAVMSGNAICAARGARRRRGSRPTSSRWTRTTWRSTRACIQVDAGRSIPLRTVAVLSNPLRYAFDEAAKATQFARPGTTKPPRSPAMRRAGAPRLLLADPVDVRVRRARGDRGDRPTTWEIDVVKYAVVHDCGNVVNPMIVEGQVHGGVAQGVGGALYERMAYDKDGQLQNASFMDFLMPYASEVPDIDIDHQRRRL